MRDINQPNVIKAGRVVGDIVDKDCILVDDMIDTAGTISAAVEVLRSAGAKSVTVAATHGIFSGPAPEHLQQAGVREVICTDTLPIPPEKRFSNLTVLSIAPLIAPAIKAVFESKSVGAFLRDVEDTVAVEKL
jgi:ribose-phosphate pyrophosphokinase